jgi:AP2-like factor (euAP2 lineage)
VPKPGGGGGRTFTSRFRGVHQTFPTRRWEAQFRRAGRPTSLGAPAFGRDRGLGVRKHRARAGAALCSGAAPQPLPTDPKPAPTPAGCFDREEDAARAYDRMMLWIEMHGAGSGARGGVTNFDVSAYAGDLAWLAGVTQVEGLGPQGAGSGGARRRGDGAGA